MHLPHLFTPATRTHELDWENNAYSLLIFSVQNIYPGE